MGPRPGSTQASGERKKSSPSPRGPRKPPPEKDQLDEDAPAELPEESVLPEDGSRQEVAKLLGAARRVSLDRLLGVCGDKLAALQGRIR